MDTKELEVMNAELDGFIEKYINIEIEARKIKDKVALAIDWEVEQIIQSVSEEVESNDSILEEDFESELSNKLYGIFFDKIFKTNGE